MSRKTLFSGMPYRENGPLPLYYGAIYTPRGVNDDVPENLLGQVPMLGSGPAADIGRVKQHGHQNPRIVHDLIGIKKFQLHGHISADADPSEPALSGPPGKELGGLGP